MQHTTEELALAANIMRFAAEARQRTMPPGFSSEEQRVWLEMHPLIGYVPDVMTRLQEVADTVSSIRARQS